MSENYIPKIKKNPEDCSKDFCLCKVNLGLRQRGWNVLSTCLPKSDTSSYVSELSYTVSRVFNSFQKSKAEGRVLLSHCSLELSPEHSLTCCCVPRWEAGLGCQSSCRLKLPFKALGQWRGTHRAHRHLSWDTTPQVIWLCDRQLPEHLQTI